MKRIISLMHPSVIVVLTAFLVVFSCKQPSNFEGGDRGGNKSEALRYSPVSISETPPLDNTSPPPPPTESDALKTNSEKQYKYEIGEESQEPQKVEIDERKVIKTGEVRFKTLDLAQTRQSILDAVSGLKGYVNEESQTGDGTYVEMHLTVRIPALYFDSLMTVISSNAEYFDSKNIHTQDVTEEFIDVSTRVRTKKSLENQYLTILKQAKSIKEIMEVRRELNTVREEIESAEGRLRYLSSQVSYSTLTLAFYKDISGRGGSPRGFWSRIGDGFVNSWQMLLDFVVVLVSTLPILLIFGGIFWAFRWFWMRQKTKNETPQ